MFLFLGACESDNLLPYLFKQGFHQGALLLKAKEAQDLLKDPHTSQQVQKFLALSEKVRAYANNVAGMNVGLNYTRFIDVGGDRRIRHPNQNPAYEFKIRKYLVWRF